MRERFLELCIAPDGSKELWEESDAGDHRRAENVVWLRQQVSENHRPLLDWVEVMFGDELGRSSEVINDSTQLAAPEDDGEIPF